MFSKSQVPDTIFQCRYLHNNESLRTWKPFHHYHPTVIWSFNSTEETYVRLSLEHSKNRPGLRFDSTWKLTFNDEEFFTEGSTSTENGGYSDYTFSTIAYVKAKVGKNTFKMVHASTQGYNIRSLNVVYQNGNIEIAQAER